MGRLSRNRGGQTQHYTIVSFLSFVYAQLAKTVVVPISAFNPIPQAAKRYVGWVVENCPREKGTERRRWEAGRICVGQVVVIGSLGKFESSEGWNLIVWFPVAYVRLKIYLQIFKIIVRDIMI